MIQLLTVLMIAITATVFLTFCFSTPPGVDRQTPRRMPQRAHAGRPLPPLPEDPPRCGQAGGGCQAAQDALGQHLLPDH